MTLHEHFDRIASDAGARTAVHDGEKALSYDDLNSASVRMTHALESAGVSAGDRVGLMLPNSAPFVASYFAIARAGGVIAPLNVRYKRQELEYYLDDTEASALIVSPALVDVAMETIESMDHAPALLVAHDAGELELHRAGSGRSPAPISDIPGLPLMIQYTSGSTGAPKRVIRTHENLLFELERLQSTFGLGPADRLLGAAPFTHVNGLVRTMLTSMYVGATLFPMATFDRRKALATITEHRITYFGAVPYMFVLLADSPLRGEVDLSSLRVAFSASAPLLPDDNRRFREKYGIGIRQLYGSTETGTISVNMHDDTETCIDSVGAPLPDVTITVIGDDGNPVDAGVEGEVMITSPGAITAYAGNAEASAASFRDGSYLSGDLGRMNEDGCLVLTGRKKFLINRGGFKVNPLEVEDAIMSHPSVREVAVYGAPSAHGDDVVQCAVVVDGECTQKDILDHCRERIADYKIPSRVAFMDALPKSDTGKLLRHKLRDT